MLRHFSLAIKKITWTKTCKEWNKIILIAKYKQCSVKVNNLCIIKIIIQRNMSAQIVNTVKKKET